MVLPAGSIDAAVLPATLRIILWYADGGGTVYETREFPLAIDTTTGDVPNQNFAFAAQGIPPGGAVVVAVRPEGAAIGPNGLTLEWTLTTE